MGGPQRPECSVDCRADQFVFVVGLGDREGRCHVHEHVDAAECLAPTVVGAEVERDELEGAIDVDAGFEAGLHGSSHLVAPFEAPDRAPHVVAGVQESLHRVLGDVAARTGDERCGHEISSKGSTR